VAVGDGGDEDDEGEVDGLRNRKDGTIDAEVVIVEAADKAEKLDEE
jgi:hypothetical protein